MKKTERNMKPFLPIFWALLSALSANSALAETSIATSGLSKKFPENTEISDSKLKADSGSLSRFSLRFKLGFDGPPVGDLSAADQPNPDGTVGVTATAITGSAGMRYRFDSQRSLSLTTGISNQYPFRNESRFEASNPYLSYSSAFRWGGMQMISTPGVSYITADKLRAVGQVASVNYELSSVYDLGESPVSVGLDGTLNHFFFNREYRKKDGKVRRIGASLSPNLKAKLSQAANIYTSITFAYWNPRAVESRFELQPRSTTGKLGFGYSITRDIYISPYLGYYPREFSWRTASLNLSTVFSVL